MFLWASRKQIFLKDDFQRLYYSANTNSGKCEIDVLIISCHSCPTTRSPAFNVSKRRWIEVLSWRTELFHRWGDLTCINMPQIFQLPHCVWCPSPSIPWATSSWLSSAPSGTSTCPFHTVGLEIHTLKFDIKGKKNQNVLRNFSHSKTCDAALCFTHFSCVHLFPADYVGFTPLHCGASGVGSVPPFGGFQLWVPAGGV